MKHASKKPCQHVMIAESEVGDVAVCPDCGVVHIALQYFSMRFDLAAFADLAQMLGAAQGRIERVLQVAQAADEKFDLLKAKRAQHKRDVH